MSGKEPEFENPFAGLMTVAMKQSRDLGVFTGMCQTLVTIYKTSPAFQALKIDGYDLKVIMAEMEKLIAEQIAATKG